MRKVSRGTLKFLGYRSVLEASDGEIALERLSEDSVTLVLSEWDLPRMDGPTLLASMRKTLDTRYLPFMFLTYRISADRVARAAELGANGYLVKPFSPIDLNAKIRRILNPPSPLQEVDAMIRRGMEMLENGDYQGATDELFEAQQIYQLREATILHLLAEVNRRQKDTDTAKDYLTQAISKNPLYVKAFHSLGEIYADEGNYEEASQMLKRAVEISPLDGTRLATLAEVLVDSGQPEEAELIYRQAREIDPSTVFSYNKLGIAYRRKKMSQHALDAYAKALRMEPDNERIYYNMALVFLDVNRRGNAETCLRRALKVSPEFAEAQRLLDEVWKDGNRLV